MSAGAINVTLERMRGVILRRYLRLRNRREFRCHGNLIRGRPGVLDPTVFRASLRFVDRCLEEAPQGRVRVLELGCGTGVAACALARHGHRVTAVDRSMAAAACCAANAHRNRLSVTVVNGSWAEGFEDRSFDYVICNPPFLSRRPSQLDEYLERALWAGEGDARLRDAIVGIERCLSASGRALVMTSQQTDRGRLESVYRDLGLSCSTSSIRHHGDRLLFDLLRRKVP